MSNGLLLWIDDEIELLKAHIIFLEKKGYEVQTVSNGPDAIELCRQQTFDLILLDEMMPGLSGLETLLRIKDIQPSTPVVMCTKSEEENIMDQAIGSKIADYLIKPVNPNQILLSLKKNIHRKDIVAEVTQNGYQQDYQQIAMQMMECRSAEDWMEIYRRLVSWELKLSDTASPMAEMLGMQKEEANQGFAKYIAKNYLDWVSPDNRDRHLMSPDIFKRKIFPLLDEGKKVFLIVIDNFRYDQWRMLAEDIGDQFDIDEQLYMSILPTATQYARNAIFSGLMPNKIAEMFPDLWVDEDEEEGKNLNEAPLIQTQIERFRKHYTFSYHKVNDSQGADRFLEHYNECRNNDLNVLVINFIDMLSHAYRIQDGARACQQRECLPQHHAELAPPFGSLRALQAPFAERLSGSAHHRPRQHQGIETNQDCRRPQYEHQPALQAGQESGLPEQGSFHHQGASACPIAGT